MSLRPELDLFSSPAAECCVGQQQVLKIDPSSGDPSNPNSTIHFIIPANKYHYTDMASMMLVMEASIIDSEPLLAEGKEGAAYIAPSNLLISSAFQDVQLRLNGTLVEGGHQLYGYKSYMLTLLHYGERASQNLCYPWGFKKDDAGTMGMVDENIGALTRARWLNNGQRRTFAGPLFLDLCMQERYLLNGVDIEIRMQPASSDWVLMGRMTGDAKISPTCRLKIHKVHLTLRRVVPAPDLIASQIKRLEIDNAKYPAPAFDMLSYMIPSGSRSHTRENVFQGQIPRLLVMAMVWNEAFTGSYQTNPLEFVNPGCNFLGVYVDNVSVPAQPLTFSEDGIQPTDYAWFRMQLGHALSNRDFLISSNEYANGFTMFAFSLSSDFGLSGGVDMHKQGQLRIDMRFGTALPKVLSVIVMGVFDRTMEITEQRMVLSPGLYH